MLWNKPSNSIIRNISSVINVSGIIILSLHASMSINDILTDQVQGTFLKYYKHNI